MDGVDSIHCHDKAPRYVNVDIIWDKAYVPEPEPPVYEYCGKQHYSPFQPWRTCSYCGSMHPSDLLEALSQGANLSTADWKYGWPHKLYVNRINNPYPDLPIVTSHAATSTLSDSGLYVLTTVCGKPHRAGPLLMGKFYTIHLTDTADPTFTELVEMIAERTHIRFEKQVNENSVDLAWHTHK